MESQADNSVKNWQNLPISNPKPDLNNVNAHAKFRENIFIFTQVIVRKRKYGRTSDGSDGRTETRTANMKKNISKSLLKFYPAFYALI